MPAIDPDGEYMTLLSFVEKCVYGNFTDDSGFGYLCIGDEMTHTSLTPSELLKGFPGIEDYDGILWYKNED